MTSDDCRLAERGKMIGTRSAGHEVLGDERTNVGRDLMFEFDAKERL